MAKLIKGCHHIALRANSIKKYEELVHFYHDILQMDMIRSWGSGENLGCMLDTGDAFMELFSIAQESDKTGSINHFALSCDDVDEVIKLCRNEGYKVKIEPKDISIASNPPYPARIAFVYGPVGEEIEFFNVK